MRSQKCLKCLTAAKELDGNHQVWFSNSKDLSLSHNKKRSILVGIHTMYMCVCDDKTLLIYCFSLTFNFLTTLGIRIAVSTRKKLLGMQVGREKVKGGLGGPFLLWMHSLIYTQASIRCLHFTTVTSIIFVLSAKITTPQRPRKPPKSIDKWSVMHILSLSL